jgi:hypothetical protein
MSIRLWKIGSLEHGVTPTPETVKELEDKLKAWRESDEDVLDLVWGPDIQLEVHSTCKNDDDKLNDKSKKKTDVGFGANHADSNNEPPRTERHD